MKLKFWSWTFYHLFFEENGRNANGLVIDTLQEKLFLESRVCARNGRFSIASGSIHKSQSNKMDKSGPVVIIEDDLDDQFILTEAFTELNFANEIIFFRSSLAALEYLVNTDVKPFLILSDINMPILNGLELQAKIQNNEDLRMKSIPYLFFSTSAEQKHVVEAYSRSIQGFFVKPYQFDKLKSTLGKIMDYWLECVAPNYIKNTQ